MGDTEKNVRTSPRLAQPVPLRFSEWTLPNREGTCFVRHPGVRSGIAPAPPLSSPVLLASSRSPRLPRNSRSSCHHSTTLANVQERIRSGALPRRGWTTRRQRNCGIHVEVPPSGDVSEAVVTAGPWDGSSETERHVCEAT